MKRIWKYQIDLNSGSAYAVILVPPQRVFRAAAMQGSGIIALWFEVDNDAVYQAEELNLHVYGTGHVILPTHFYLGTVFDGPFVWHVYEGRSGSEPSR